jgi:steroid delta-isomerase-like uncharacterized protein
MKKLCMILPLALILCFMVGCQDKEVMAELEEFKAKAAVEEQNKEIVREALTLIDEGNLDRFKELLSEDFALTAPGMPEPWNTNMLLQAIKEFYLAFPDSKHVIEDMVADSDKIAIKLYLEGTHKMEYEGIPATGKKVKISAIFWITITDGRIKNWWNQEDSLGMMMQLGFELKPKEGEK